MHCRMVVFRKRTVSWWGFFHPVPSILHFAPGQAMMPLPFFQFHIGPPKQGHSSMCGYQLSVSSRRKMESSHAFPQADFPVSFTPHTGRTVTSDLLGDYYSPAFPHNQDHFLLGRTAGVPSSEKTLKHQPKHIIVYYLCFLLSTKFCLHCISHPADWDSWVTFMEASQQLCGFRSGSLKQTSFEVAGTFSSFLWGFSWTPSQDSVPAWVFCCSPL